MEDIEGLLQNPLERNKFFSLQPFLHPPLQVLHVLRRQQAGGHGGHWPQTSHPFFLLGKLRTLEAVTSRLHGVKPDLGARLCLPPQVLSAPKRKMRASGFVCPMNSPHIPRLPVPAAGPCKGAFTAKAVC